MCRLHRVNPGCAPDLCAVYGFGHVAPVFARRVTIDKLLRALVGITLFTGAYLAEAIRGGLQAPPRAVRSSRCFGPGGIGKKPGILFCRRRFDGDPAVGESVYFHV